MIDTHCHLDDSKIIDKAFEIECAKNVGVNKIINMACDKESIYSCLGLANSFKEVYFGAGIHPEYSSEYSLEIENIIKEVSKNPKCVAVGEIGLDYHYEGYDRESQINAFVSQIKLANRLEMPISIHSRDAFKDTVDILKENKQYLSFGGVMHCYSGSVETAKILLDLGLYFSFAGTVTFKNAKSVKEVAEFLPVDRILTETDSPYLSPHPFRGTVNGPRNIPFILRELATIKNIEQQKLEEIIKENAERLFYKLK
ncbi:MAG: TatD family hydrolase [Clostridia bacterium]|nr:TatD family hydrolase [Clostridia bacterium]